MISRRLFMNLRVKVTLLLSVGLCGAVLLYLRLGDRNVDSTPTERIESAVQNPKPSPVVEALVDAPEAHEVHVTKEVRLDEASQSKIRNQEMEIIADFGRTLPERLAALNQALVTAEDSQVVDELLLYLRTHVPLDGGAVERERALRNSIMNGLRDLGTHQDKIVSGFGEIWEDSGLDSGVRDYSLQHLAAYMVQIGPDNRRAAEAYLTAALKSPDATYAGTALLGLNDAKRQSLLSGDFDVGSESVRIVLDEKYSMQSRLTAMALTAGSDIRDERIANLATKWIERPLTGDGAKRAAANYLSVFTN